jgi:hypothetical protein
MNGVQRVAVLIALTGMVTALTLPGRKTPEVVDAFTRLFTGGLKTAQGR